LPAAISRAIIADVLNSDGKSTLSNSQPGILNAVPDAARYLEFTLKRDADPAPSIAALTAQKLEPGTVIGFGRGLVELLGLSVPLLRAFPNMSGPGCEVPSTQTDVWCFIGGTDRGEILHRGRAIEELLGEAFDAVSIVDGFKTGGGRDLSGYEDGTENPVGGAAEAAAIATGIAGIPDGSSFVAVQQWRHDLDHFASLGQTDQDHVIGRRLSDNEELDDAPASAHVKRTAQESFEPEAFVVRRSMPWADANAEGLMFVAFGCSLDAFEVQMRRMAGLDDGIVDGIFRLSQPLTGGYFWCPPIVDGALSLLGAAD